MNNSPNPNTTPSVTEDAEWLRTYAESVLDGSVMGVREAKRLKEIADRLVKSSAPQQTGLTDVERLLREARSYVEQAGLRHHDVSGLLAEIDAVLRSRSNQVMEEGDNG